MTENLNWLTDGIDGDLELTEVDTIRAILEHCIEQKWSETSADLAERRIMELGHSLALARDILGTAWYHGLDSAMKMVVGDIDIPLGWDSIDTSAD